MKFPYLYCGNITTKCPEKMVDGRCKLTERLDEAGQCPDSVLVENPDMGFLIKYLYYIRSGAPRIISTTTQPMQTYPNNLYCAQIEKHCPHQTPGGKCKLHENMPGEGGCKHEIYLTEEMELAIRLLQFIHRDKDKQK